MSCKQGVKRVFGKSRELTFLPYQPNLDGQFSEKLMFLVMPCIVSESLRLRIFCVRGDDRCLLKLRVPFLDERMDAFNEIRLRRTGRKAFRFGVQLLAHGVR